MRWLVLLLVACTSVTEPRSAMLPGEVRLHFLAFGGSGEPIVLLAGAGNTAWIYSEFGRELAREHRVFALTRRGHGASDAPAAGYDHAALTDDIRRFLDTQGLSRVVLVGHSLAGEELTAFAARYPDRVRGLVYLDAAYDRSQQDAANADVPDVFVPPTPEDRASKAAFIAYVRKVNKSLARYWTPAVQRDVEASVVVHSDGTAGNRNRPIFDVYWSAMMSAPPDYTKVKVPVLAIYAHEDERYQLPADASPEVIAQLERWQDGPLKAWREASIAQLRAAIPTATIVDMVCGHHMFLHRPQETLAAVRAFLASL